MKKFIIILVVIFAILIPLLIWLSKEDAKVSKYKVGNEGKNLVTIGEVFENQGQTHIKPGEAHPPYNSNPPTSGWHWIQPADWGVYNKPLVDEQAVHNLEHGGIWISYKNIDIATEASLGKIAKANSGSVIISPRDANDAKIVLASWTRLERLDSYDEAKILGFIKANKNKSPEPIAR